MSRRQMRPPAAVRKGRSTPRQATVLAEQRVRNGRLQAWLADRADKAARARAERVKAREKAREEGVLTPAQQRDPLRGKGGQRTTNWVVQHRDLNYEERRARGILARSGNVPYVNEDKDRRLSGKARRRARRSRPAA